MVCELGHCCTDPAGCTVLQRTKKMLIHFVVTGEQKASRGKDRVGQIKEAN
jgi:hypothetical protein